MWIIAGHVTVDEDKRDAFVEAHRDLVQRARQARPSTSFSCPSRHIRPADILGAARARQAHTPPAQTST